MITGAQSQVGYLKNKHEGKMVVRKLRDEKFMVKGKCRT
jgi:hypothetical protein